MSEQTAIKLFETQKIRTAWNEDEEEWYFSVVDVVGVLTESPDSKRYWSVLKTRLKQEGIEGTTICSTLKLLAQDGKMRLTDVASRDIPKFLFLLWEFYILYFYGIIVCKKLWQI